MCCWFFGGVTLFFCFVFVFVVFFQKIKDSNLRPVAGVVLTIPGPVRVLPLRGNTSLRHGLKLKREKGKGVRNQNQ